MTTPGGANPLVAPRLDSTTGYSGVGIAESLADVHQGVTSGSWVEGGLALAGTGLETLGLAIDPLGALAAYGVGWLMEHVQPLSDALDWLAGDPDAIASFAATWRNVGQAVSAAGEDFAAQVASGTATWTGQAGEGYRGFAQGQIERISAAGRAAEILAAVVEGAGVLVGVVREVVRDLVAECVATLIVRLPQWLAEEGATLGLATPHVVASAVALIAKWVARIGEVITKLIRSLHNLMPLIRQLDEIFAALRDGFRSADRVAAPPTPDGGPGLPQTSPVAAPNAPDITTGAAPASSGGASPGPTAPVSGGPDLPARDATTPTGTSTPTLSRVTPTPDAPTSPTGSQGGTPSISEPTPPGRSQPSRIAQALEPDTLPAAADWSKLKGTTRNVSQSAIHAGVVEPRTAERFLRDRFPEVLNTNRDRWLHNRPGHDINCTHCVVTLDRQLAGLDAQATGRRTLGDSLADMEDQLPSGQWRDSGSYDNVIKHMRDQAVGARGVVYIARPDGSAHVFNVVHSPDGVVFLDGQTGTLASLEPEVTHVWLYHYR